MSEPLFELKLKDLDMECDAYDLANKLAEPLATDAKYLEKQLVKIKFSNGRSEALKTGLTKSEAQEYQEKAKHFGLELSIEEGWALVPIEETVIKDTFVCPACDVEQETDEGKVQICKQCGIVKHKYEEVEKRKKDEKERIQQIKAMERQARVRPRKSVEQRNEEFLDKKFGQKMPKKSQAAVLLSILLGTVVISAGSYVYLNNEEVDLDSTEKTVNTMKGEPNTELLKNSQNNIAVNSDLGDDSLEGLGNPYSKFASPSKPTVSMKEGVKQINTLLEKTNLKLEKVDKAALEDISTLYQQSEKMEQDAPDYNSIKSIASSIHDEEIRSEVVRQASWGEVEDGIKSFDELGIYPLVRQGEEVESAELTKELIDFYIRSREFKEATEMASQIKDHYLRAITLNQVMNAQIDIAPKGAISQRNKIREISKLESLSHVQKALILGVLSQSERLLKNQEIADGLITDVQLAMSDIKDTQEKIYTLIQLSEDQREGLSLKYAHSFLEDADLLVANEHLDDADKDKVYRLLSERYARIFEFKRAKEIMAKINNSKEKVILAEKITSIEKQTLL